MKLPPLSDEEIRARTLRIDVSGSAGAVSKGSGVCLGANIGLTNWHVVQNASLDEGLGVSAVTENGVIAKVHSVALDFAYFDVALIRFDRDICPGAVPVKSPDASASDSPILNVSSPNSSSFVSFRGSLDSPTPQALGATSYRQFNFDWVPYEIQILTSADLAESGVGSGSSGSAVFQDGRMLGVVFAKAGQEDRIFIVDSSFLTLKPFVDLEWHKMGNESLMKRFSETVNLSPTSDTKVPLPLSFTIRSDISQSSVESHQIGTYWDRVKSSLDNPLTRLTYGNGRDAVLCLIRSEVPNKSGLITLGLSSENGADSCVSPRPDAITEEAIFIDDNNDGLTDRISIGKKQPSF